jgi:5-methylthioribose kinase
VSVPRENLNLPIARLSSGHLPDTLQAQRVAVNIEAPAELIQYLRAAGRLNDPVDPEVIPLAGGVSNRTVLLRRADPHHGAWVLKQALPKLRVAQEWLCDPARIQREALGLRWLERHVPASVPRFLFEDPNQFVFAMEAVPEPHDNWKTQLLAGHVDLELVTQFSRLLQTIHQVSVEESVSTRAAFGDTSFFEALRLLPYYQSTAACHPVLADFFDALIAETRATRVCLVHGDYSPKNILVHRRHLVLLDHEVIHFGDPAFDLGFSLTHFLSKARHLPQRRALLLEAAQLHWQEYRRPWTDEPSELKQPSPGPAAPSTTAAAGRELERRAVHHTLACLLARVDGRSPLEYLGPDARDAQRQFVLRTVKNLPASLADLISACAADMRT